MLTQKRIKEVLSYNPTTGLFVRRTGIKAGPVPRGDVESHIKISIDGKQYFAHDLAWLYVTGNWPAGKIVQIDSMKHDNRFSNLADVTHADRFRTQIPWRVQTQNHIFAQFRR